MTIRPVNIVNRIAILFVLKIKYIADVLVKAKNNDKTIGLVNILKSILLDHLESTEKNKNRDASITIGINIAL
jgi:hypothetical protein